MNTPRGFVRCLFVAAVALMLFPKPALADGFGIGIKGGYVFSNLSFSNASNVFNGKSGFQAGLFLGSKRPVGALLELNYLERRAVDVTTGATTTLHYLDVPVLLKINFGSSHTNGVSFFVDGGPAFDFKIGDDISSLAQVQNYESFDFALIASAGVELTRFIIEGRGQWGLRNIAVNSFSAGNLHSRSFALLFGFRFN
jgi:hypothetical protein